MKALVYQGPFKKEFMEIDKPVLINDTDAIVKMVKTTICGSDLHLLKGDVPVPPGNAIGHEGVGVIEEVGSAVKNFKKGDRVIISCITSDGTCEYCKKGLPSHCENGGCILGFLMNGTQAEFVRTPLADTSLYHLPDSISSEEGVLIADILPTGLEMGAQSAKLQPGETVAIVGAGPVGIAALITAQFYSPSKIIVLDLDDNRLELAKKFGATDVINSSDAAAAVAKIKELTGGKGVDVAMEVVGIPQTLELCQGIIDHGGRIANIGVHGQPVNFALDKLSMYNFSFTTGLVNTTSIPMIIKAVESGKIRPKEMITHRYKFDDIVEAYDVFMNAAKEKSLKIIIDFE